LAASLIPSSFNAAGLLSSAAPNTNKPSATQAQPTINAGQGNVSPLDNR
jgi:hypothetical protein